MLKSYSASRLYIDVILAAMVLAKEAWCSITPETIQNCWNHTHIQLESYAVNGGLDSLVDLPSSSQSTTPHADPLAWKIIYEFTTTDLSLPNTEIRLKVHLGNCFIDADWQPALCAVMDAEGDFKAALKAIQPLEHAAMQQPGLKIQISCCLKELPQLKSTKNELMQSIDVLKSRNRIFDTPPTLDELLDPPEEAEIREMDLFTIGEKGEKEIVEMVEHEMAVARGEVIEIDSDEDEDLVGAVHYQDSGDDLV
ncbi:hypothetical protein PAXRUDRAFT_805617 [Paxillus rubicundulus Ve08.2h10]|uniref:Uncharacterized protein n=1 Tax=Paxillus rubicundulus Ve08.2h10 TaxID=930991 RepID=A0A0D0CH93_9AGAM|nr:hypothetical protein PAXRUDRAFT_805617 [Paxillus rubicundulus Ve08.2h10]